jgi:hypothetical protein
MWHALAGPIQNYLNNPLFKYWFPETHDFYTTARNFFDDHTEQVTGDQMALIPWVQSVVIRHYILGRMVYFQNENNYLDLYWYLDDLIALYLTEGFNLRWVMTYDINQNLKHTQKAIAAIWSSFIRTLLIGVPSIKRKPVTKDSSFLPSMRTYFPMTIISIEMGKELINHTASMFSSNKGGVNQNHLHHLHHASVNVVLLVTMIT